MPDFKKSYDFIISLGRFCHTTALLANNGLKVIDGPWDWSGTAHRETIYGRIECLYKGFENYFNKEDFVPFDSYKQDLYTDWCNEAIGTNGQMIGAPDTNVRGAYYNKRTRTYYLHDFSAKSSLDEQFPQIKEKYARRFMRTLNFIKASNSVLLVYMNNMADQRRNMPLETSQVLRVMHELRAKYPAITLDLYMFDHSSAFDGKRYQRIVHDVGIIRYLSNHHDVFPATDQVLGHRADDLMMPISICYILSKIELTDKHKMI